MQVYKAPIKDYRFLIKDFLNSEYLDIIFKNSDLNIDDLEMILEEASKLCEETLLPINQLGDLEGCSFKNGDVKTPKGFKEAYKSFVENGWQGLTVDKKYGGQQLPYFINMFFIKLCFIKYTLIIYFNINFSLFKVILNIFYKHI